MNYNPAADNLAARESFQDARFGMFVHWGVYSVLGSGEWVMNDRPVMVGDYEKLPAFFNPIDFDPAEWVRLIKRAGMKYMTFTSRHHDGFAMFQTKANDWNIVDRTAYKHDIVRMLAEECRNQGIKFFLYYSLIDWRHEDFYPRGETGQGLGRSESGDWNIYWEYMHTQLTELLTNYGRIDGLWFDGWWDVPDADWRLDDLYTHIHSLQPHLLIGNNHHRLPFAGEDFQMWERDLPGKNTSGYSPGTQIGSLPLETCDTLNDFWGFNLTDRNYKSPKQLIHYLVRSSGNGANLLLNVGPMPNGKIQREFVERLEAVGQWLEKHGDSIYGTRRGPVAPTDQFVSTQSPDGLIYLHVLETPDDGLVRFQIPEQVHRASLFSTGQSVRLDQSASECEIRLNEADIDACDTIIVLNRQ